MNDDELAVWVQFASAALIAVVQANRADDRMLEKQLARKERRLSEAQGVPPDAEAETAADFADAMLQEYRARRRP